jgi:hypothetical protein
MEFICCLMMFRPVSYKTHCFRIHLCSSFDLRISFLLEDRKVNASFSAFASGSLVRG